MSNVGSAPPGPDANALERAIGGKLAVWVGAIALALGGVFLVKYSIDQGWIGPEARILGGIVLGFGLGGVAWYLRDRSNYVAQGLAAAAVIDMYAVLWAAAELYLLIPPWLAFVGMVGTTLFAMAFSLRLGPLVAALGFLGAFLAPWLVGGNAHPAQLFAYLLALQAGGQLLRRFRQWHWIHAISLSSGAIWVVLFLAVNIKSPDEAIWAAVFLLASTAILVLPEVSESFGKARGALRVGLTVGLNMPLLGLTVLFEFSPVLYALLFAMTAAAGALAVWKKRFAILPWITLAVVAAVLSLEFSSGTSNSDTGPLILLSLSALTHLAIGYAGVWRAQSRQFLALLPAATLPFVLIGMAQLWSPIHQLLGEHGMMHVLLAIALVYALLALPMLRRREQHGALTALFVPAQLFLAVAWPFGLEFRECIGLWSLQLVAAFALHRWLRSGGLRIAGAALLITLQLSLLTPIALLLADDVGSWPLIHWASAAYLAAIIATAAARRLTPEHFMRAVLAVSTAVLAMAGAAVNIHHACNAGNMMALRLPAIEVSMHVMVVLLAALWLLARSPHQRLAAGEARVLQNLGVALAMIGMFIGALLLATLGNPWLTREPVRGVFVLNSLLFGIGLPALLSGLIAWQLGVKGFAAERLAAWWPTGALIVFGVIMQVRHVFHGNRMWVGDTLQAEHYAYSIALALLALLSLALGIRRNTKPLRVLALVGMLVCSIKVFGFDMRELEGIYRVLSFLGLGASLMLLGYLYNRFGPKLPAQPAMPGPNPTARPVMAGPAPQLDPKGPGGLMTRRTPPPTSVVPRPQSELPPREEILTDSNPA